jgi:hypothetical protein
MLVNGRQWEEDMVLRVADAIGSIVAEKGWKTKVPVDRIQLL